MPKINPQDLDEDLEIDEELRNPNIARPKRTMWTEPGLSKEREERRLTKIARRRERLANQHWENTND